MDNQLQKKETLEGYVVDIACLRNIPALQLSKRAKEHTTACALMGHCIESGYGLVDIENRIMLLDSEATPRIVGLLKETTMEKGVQLKVEREKQKGKMKTTKVFHA
ncbi:MAG: hypothetical protein WD555_06020 [Fulvivirga sp.]